MTSRSRTTLSQSSLHLEGLRKDKAFLQRLTKGRGPRDEMRWSVAGEKGPNTSQSYNGEAIANTENRSVWRRDKFNWTYNMRDGNPQSQSNQFTNVASPKSRLRFKNLDDLQLRKLLEELYRDKKYMDKLIDTTAPEEDNTEAEVCSKLQSGREYLLKRALFWLDKGPLPARPPTTDLGYRLQRAQTAPTNPRDQQVSPQNQINPTLAPTQEQHGKEEQQQKQQNNQQQQQQKQIDQQQQKRDSIQQPKQQEKQAASNSTTNNSGDSPTQDLVITN